MKKVLRRFAFLLSLAFALAIGQQIGLVHGLGHAAERIAQKQDSKLPAPACDQCGLFAQLDGPAPAGLPELGAVDARVEAPAFHPVGGALATRVVFLARAPPVLS